MDSKVAVVTATTLPRDTQQSDNLEWIKVMTSSSKAICSVLDAILTRCRDLKTDVAEMSLIRDEDDFTIIAQFHDTVMRYDCRWVEVDADE